MINDVNWIMQGTNNFITFIQIPNFVEQIFFGLLNLPGKHIACKKSMRQLSYLRVWINCVKISLSFFKAKECALLNVFDGPECSLNRKTNYRRR